MDSMSGDSFLDQNEIERLLGGGGGGSASTPPPSPTPPPAADTATTAFLDQSELDALMSGLGGSPKPTPSKPAAAAPPLPPAPVAAAPLVPPPPAMPPLAAALPVMPPIAAAPPVMPPIAASPLTAAPPVFMPQIPQHAEPVGDEEGIPHGDLNYLLKRANEAIQSIASSKPELPAEVIEFQFPEFGGSTPSSDHATLDQISEVELDVKIELGRSQMYLEDVLSLRRGSVVALDKMAGDAVDIYVNGRLLARGEVLVMNENFCVRVAELLAGTIPVE
ncbi:MAG: flagellar motor switch protein FliN [Thermoguttaceae bacterium]